MQTVTINLPQLNTLFGLAMPVIVAFLAGLIRQDRFPAWANELITYAVLILFAAAQTVLSGQGLDSILHFLIIAAWTFGGLHTKYGSDFQSKVQTATSIAKLPPAPPALPTVNINPAQVAALLLEQILPVIQQTQAPVPVPDQPTQAVPAIQPVRTNTPLGG